MQGRTDRTDALLSIEAVVIHQVIGTPQVFIKTQVGVDVADAVLVTQIVYQHGLSPCFIHLLFLAKQGKQTQETG